MQFGPAKWSRDDLVPAAEPSGSASSNDVPARYAFPEITIKSFIKFLPSGRIIGMNKTCLWIALGLVCGSLSYPADGQKTSWSPTEKAFLDAAEKVDAHPNDVQAMKDLTQLSQQLVNYYVKEEAKIDPYDLDSRLQVYEKAIRTRNQLFDRTYEQKISELTRKKNAVLQRIEQAGEEKDTLRRLMALNELGYYKPYMAGITELEDRTVKELFAAYKSTQEGPAQIDFLKNNLNYVKTPVGTKFFALVYNDLKTETAASLKKGLPLKAGAQADIALQFWPTDAYFRETARQTVENF
jgi:hypothetical protein